MKWSRNLPFHGESLGQGLSVIRTHVDFGGRSSPLHFVDAEGELNFIKDARRELIYWVDNPPTSCSVSESRDCSNGKCICAFPIIQSRVKTICLFIAVTAIANYTTRVVDKSLSAEQLQEALKFLGAFMTFIRVSFNNSHLRVF